MKPSQTIRFGMATTVLLLLLAACVHPSDSDSSGSGSSTSETSSSSQIEPTTGLESPESPTNGSIAISMASAPVGSQGAFDPNGACIRISWLGNPIPRGDVVTITSATVHSPFKFDPAVTATCDTPSCINYQFSAANDNGPSCYVGLGYPPGSIMDHGNYTVGSMELVGRLRCQANVGFTACHHHAAALGTRTVSFNVHTIEKTPPSSSPPVSTTVSPPESSSSSPPASSSSSPVASGSP